jgi:hypothetical protein
MALVHGGKAPTMTSYKTPANQPYSLYVHRDGRVEIIYDQTPNVSHTSPSRHQRSTSVPTASPRSTAATFGSTNTRIAASTAHRDSSPSTSRHHDSSPSTSRHHVPSTHHHHHHASETHRSTSAHTSHHIPVPAPSDRHRHHSTSSVDRRTLPVPIPVQPHSSSHTHSRSRSHSLTPSPQSSPQKHARFARLPSSVPPPTVTASGHLAPPSPHSYQPPAPVAIAPHRSPQKQSSSLAVPSTSRHKPSTSAESFFFLQAHRPKGWYNRRGDRFVQKGVVERQATHMQWHPTFGGYPEPGAGWMDEHGHFMPHGGGILKN